MAWRLRRVEDYVDRVAPAVVHLRREAGSARVEHAVTSAGRQVIGLDPDQWRHVYLGGKVLLIDCVVTLRIVVRHYVGGVRADLNRVAEEQRLPAARRLVGERPGGEQGARGGPQRAGMRPAVAGALVEAPAGHPARDGRLGLHAHLV